MNLFHLVLRNIAGSPLRSSLILICVMLIAVSAIWAGLVIHDAQDNLQQNLADFERFEPGLVVIPRASGSANIRQVIVELEQLVQTLQAIPGIRSVLPQLQLFQLTAGEGHPEASFTLIAFDPARDVTILPRLETGPGAALNLAQGIAGRSVPRALGNNALSIDGYEISAVSTLTATGTSLDHSLFVTFDTALAIAQHLKDLPANHSQPDVKNIPTLLVNFEPGVDPQVVVNTILKEVQGVTVFDSASFFQLGREQVTSLHSHLPALLGTTWGLSVVCIALIFSISANERRREIAILRALGSTRAFVLRVVLAEGLALALTGGLAGLLLSLLPILLVPEQITRLSGVALQGRPVALWVNLAFTCLLTVLSSMLLASLYPAWKASRQDPAFQMKG